MRAGDVDAAATSAIRGLGPDVLRSLRLGLEREDDVREVFSRWAERVWLGLPAFEWRSSLRTWARRIARNVALDVRGEAWRRRERRFLTGELSDVAEEVRASTLERDEARRLALDELRATLTPAERALLDLRVNRGLRWSEVAAALSEGGERVDPAALMKRFERLKRRLGRRARALGRKS